MNRSVKHLQAYTLVARDGELGSVEEMYFDDEKWTIRYIVANLEEVPDRERAAVSPVSVEQVDWKNGTIMLDLSREDVANLSNMTTSNAIRTLSTFAQEEVISIDGRKIKILDLPKLERISDLG